MRRKFAVKYVLRLSHCVILSWTVNIQDVGPEVCLLAIGLSNTVACHISILYRNLPEIIVVLYMSTS